MAAVDISVEGAVVDFTSATFNVDSNDLFGIMDVSLVLDCMDSSELFSKIEYDVVEAIDSQLRDSGRDLRSEMQEVLDEFSDQVKRDAALCGLGKSFKQAVILAVADEIRGIVGDCVREEVQAMIVQIRNLFRASNESVV